ncbi:aminopeptidase P family N-terminal domain-containing protein, partial [Staphylococcus aureus]|nr:aminopeptidase P family N-terminal domain-containing protein [Staphylococcus aureus]
LNNQQADAAWITTPLNVYYFTGYRSEPHERLFALLIKKDGKQVLFCPKMEVEEVKASPFTGEIVGYLDTENPFSLYPQTINKLLIESEHLTVARQKQLTSGFNVNSFGDVDLTIKQLRNIKSEDEI